MLSLAALSSGWVVERDSPHGLWWSHLIHLILDRPRYILVGGIPTPLKNMKVSWDYEIPNMWGKMFQTTNQYWMAEPHIVPSTCEGSAAPQRGHRLLRLPWKRSLRQEGWIIEGKIHREASFDRKHIGFSEAYFPLKEFWDFIYFQDVQHIYRYIYQMAIKL